MCRLNLPAVLEHGDRALTDALEGATPPGMESGDETMFRSNHEHGNTVRRGDTKQDAGLATDETISFWPRGRIAFLVDNKNVVSVDLFQRVERKGVRGERGERNVPVLNPLREPMNEARNLVPSVRL